MERAQHKHHHKEGIQSQQSLFSEFVGQEVQEQEAVVEEQKEVP